MSSKQLSLSTLAIHGDDKVNVVTDVAPPMHVSTTYRYPRNPDELVPVSGDEVPSTTEPHVYSRVTHPNTTRLESLLSSILKGQVLTYSSGLAAFYAMLTFFRPRVVAISGGYHGCHGILHMHQKLYGLKIVDLFSVGEWDEAGLGEGDVVHVETPVNPTGEARDLGYFSSLAKERGAILTVDATFAPPPLMDPFALGVDVVMHSGTKYFGGHSDMLCGILAVQRNDWWEGLGVERVYLGSVLGSLEGWLGVRSVRTLELRVRQQSSSATALVKWLHDCLTDSPDVPEDERELIQATIHSIQHTSIQALDPANSWLKTQMPNGHTPVFAIHLRTPTMAKNFPSRLELFQHATSLGGVESLVEWRRMSDEEVDERLVRVSVGIEGWEDLREDFMGGLRGVKGM
ncbi:cystathionine gamma-synthase [Saitoella complicata NRRL Y-17804]|uniref:Cystathionine gamma-synthase n=1 Tax=Saitoella complicata (strain BCRC 22490 / CBS 7301 / JCM 7358 / NBRC 10748 / NRRL Y-17804) TaxID=698492 RepID=A0A0E9NF53_SAICN|nr:cystathionine gamma-synthase [Saitoella complicata NRRL Y-17804]ODQ50946.1 cystathionine gamma-synthase [Saitoella complicata NRRL Y-17804]GAO48438.1 hypothetical protein G7K_2611-t1 [Saitoella complicata NRRL Y-17804]